MTKRNKLVPVYFFFILLVGLSVNFAVSNGVTGGGPEEGVLDIWTTWGDPPETLYELFEPLTSIQLEVRSGLRDKDLLDLLENETPPDLIVLTGPDPVAAFAELGLIEDLSGVISPGDLDELYPAVRSLCSSSDHADWCAPLGADIEAFYWNKAAFRLAGMNPEVPPASLEELVSTAARLIQRDESGAIVQAGYIPDFFYPHAELYAAAMGESLINTDRALNEDVLSRVLNWEADLYAFQPVEEIEALIQSYTPYTNSKHASYAGSRTACRQCHRAAPIENDKLTERVFNAGGVAMVVDGSWLAGALPGSMDFGVAGLPAAEANPGSAVTVVSGPVVIVPTAGEDKSAALALVTRLLKPGFLAEFAIRHGTLPASRAAALDEHFQTSPELLRLIALLASPEAVGRSRSVVRPAINGDVQDLEFAVLHEGAVIERLPSSQLMAPHP
jgi:ABC-type glycerol-3-phosphate transport system substrate-binding protein